jgi:hypothetical protein
MEISLADERALLLKENLTLDQAEGRAWSKKVDAFGRMVKMASFLQRPKDDDFQLIYKEHRYQPFWHVVCRARYVYERQRDYALALSGPEVTAVTIDGVERPASNGRLNLHGVEHCTEEPRQELFIDGYSGDQNPALSSFLTYAANEIPIEFLEELSAKGAVVVPPQVRASAVVREAMLGILKSIHADRILEDAVAVEKVDLYYRPIYAFQYRWLSKDKEAVLEYDGLSGELQTEGRTYQQYMGKLMDPAFLFDVGIDTVDLFVPGGGLAIKLARKGVDVARSRSQKSG